MLWKSLPCLGLVAATTAWSSAAVGEPSASAYGVKVGSKAPAIQAADIDGKLFDSAAQLKEGPLVVVFYRGGWCPFCNTQLHSLQANVVPGIEKHKATLVAISVDLPGEEVKTKSKHALSFRIISDPKAEILGAYNVKFHVPDDLVATYKTKYGIDLEASSGQKHHVIAVPAVFVVGLKGEVTYSFVDVDYKVRAPEADILKAVERAAAR